MGILDEVDMELLLDALRRQETSKMAWDSEADLRPFADLKSKAGAVGEMQIIPSEAMEVGHGIPSIFDVARGLGFDVETEDEQTATALAKDPQVAREFARGYLTGAYDKLGSVDAAVGSYNAGIRGMEGILAGTRAIRDETANYIPGVRRWYAESGKEYPLGYVPTPPTRPTSKYAPRRVPVPQTRPAGLLEGY